MLHLRMIGYIAVLASVGFLIWLILSWPGLAASPEFCTVYAREFVRVTLLHNLDVVNAKITTPEDKAEAQSMLDMDLKWLLARNFSVCLNSDTDLKLPDIPTATNDAWMVFMMRNSVELPTTEEPDPTVEDSTEVVAEETDPKKAKCRRYFKTYNEEDGTVIRRGQKKRVQCPYL